MRPALMSLWAFVLLAAVSQAAVSPASVAYADEPPPFAFEWVLPYPPGQMTTDTQGNLWVINTNSMMVDRMTRDGHLLFPLPFPSLDITRMPNGNMLLMSSNNFVVFQDTVSIVQAYFPITGAGIGAGVQNELFVVGAGWPNLLSKFSWNGALLRYHSLAFAPSDLAVTENDVVLTLDTAGHRIVRFDRDTKYLDAWTGYDGTALATDADGNIYLASSDHITKLSPQGETLVTWGDPGDGPGQFRDAVALTLNDSGDIYVADRSTRRILMFGTRLATDDPPPPPAPPWNPTPCGLAPLTEHPAAIILHATSPSTDCLCRGPADLQSVVTSSEPSPEGTPEFVYLVASPGSSGLFGFESGVAYRPHRPDRPGLEIVSWHPCADVELPEPAWPDSGSGNTFRWESCHITDAAVGGYFEVIAHDTCTLRVVPLPNAAQVHWAACPSLDFDDIIAPDRLGWVSWGTGEGGCNAALSPCPGVTPVHPTTWGRMKTLFKTR